MTDTKMSREALYDLVWQRPLSRLVKEFGISDVWAEDDYHGFLSYSMNLQDAAPLIRSSRKGKHMSTVTLSTRIKSIYRAVGVDTSSEAGRRTFATCKNELGIGMATIQRLMGYASIQTTAIYCSVSDEQLRTAANAG
jgi:integrase/recombinase XerD